MAELTDEGGKIVTDLAQEYYEQSEEKKNGVMAIDVYSDANEYGLTHLDSGFGREVFRLPSKYVENGDHSNGYVVKLPEWSQHSTANGKKQNQYEIDAWENRLAGYQEYLVPLTDYHSDDWWIVMPAVEVVENDDPEAEQRLKELESVGFRFEDDVELGRHDGELRLLDYGYEVEIESDN